YHVDVRAPASPDCALLLFFPRAGHHRDLHSFPTRRSSDLDESGRRFDAAAAWPARLDPAHVPESIAANSDLAAFLARTKWIVDLDRKSTRLNSSHVKISYAVFCLKKKKQTDRKPP